MKKYDYIFQDKKDIEFKTDNRYLFEFSVCSMTNYGYHIQDLCLDLYGNELVDNISTEYEDKFHQKGMTIYKIEVTK